MRSPSIQDLMCQRMKEVTAMRHLQGCEEVNVMSLTNDVAIKQFLVIMADVLGFNLSMVPVQEHRLSALLIQGD